MHLKQTSLFLAAALVVIFALFAPTVQAQTQSREFTVTTDPVSLIGAYYNAIDRRDYARAYSYWEAPPKGQSQANFAAGFANTVGASVIVRLPYAMSAGAGNVFAEVPALVIAQHADGSEHYYVGCFTTHRSNVPVGNATEPDPNWRIRDGSLREISTPDLSALSASCPNNPTLGQSAAQPVQDNPAHLLQTYFGALVTRSPAQAYWENPNADVVAPTYGEAIRTAANVELFVNPVSYQEGAAGSVYADIAALTRITTLNNTDIYVNGVYTTRRSNVPVGNETEPSGDWRFVDATLSETGDQRLAISQLQP